jgi:hypothetical protein
VISTANPRVFHSALHTGSDTWKGYDLHTFPRFILRKLEANAAAQWLEPFSLAIVGGEINTNIGAIPKNFSICFGVHRDYIYNTFQVTRSGPLFPSAPASTRYVHAGALTANHPSPPILEETFPEYQKALNSLPEEPTPVTLPTLKGRFF